MRNYCLIIQLVMAGLLSAGCEESPEPGTCPPEVCGVNNTRLADERFARLSLDGEPNERGLSIVDFMSPPGESLILDVIDSAFVGQDTQSGARSTLPGSAIIVREETERGPFEWILIIDAVDEIAYMSDRLGSIPGYQLSYAPAFAPDTAQPLCTNGASIVLMAGSETYDPESLRIEPREQGRWLTLACQDHVLGKAKRMSYDPGYAAEDRYYTTPAQRQATLRMLRADYCGTGQPFTRPGTPLYWQNRAGWMVHGTPGDAKGQVEAGWNEHGATCLGTPRLPGHYSRVDIEGACGHSLPVCTDKILATSEWVTRLP